MAKSGAWRQNNPLGGRERGEGKGKAKCGDAVSGRCEKWMRMRTRRREKVNPVKHAAAVKKTQTDACSQCRPGSIGRRRRRMWRRGCQTSKLGSSR
jgi:hypothetical protein